MSSLIHLHRLNEEELDVKNLRLPLGSTDLRADIHFPKGTKQVVIFADNSAGARRCPRNGAVAAELNKAGMATVLCDLITPDEARHEEDRNDIGRLCHRLVAITDWLLDIPGMRRFHLGYLGEGAGAAAALQAAGLLTQQIRAVVSHSGKPGLANGFLADVTAPVLLFIKEDANGEMEAHETAIRKLNHTQHKELRVVPGYGDLTPDTIWSELVVDATVDWFRQHLS